MTEGRRELTAALVFAGIYLGLCCLMVYGLTAIGVV